MKNKVASLALILTFAGSLAFACEKNKNHEGAPVAQPTSATQDGGKNVNKNAKLKSKDNTQQTPSEDRQYQQALFAIYG